MNLPGHRARANVKKKPAPKRAPRASRPAVAPVAPPETDALFERIVTILEDARARVVRSVNS